MDYKKLTNITGWVVFAIAFIVYFLSAERMGSLWDCGEFITGAYKLEVVHPPGAPLFLILGRMFTFPAEVLFPDDPTKISFAVNLMSGICSAFAATFICWCTMILGRFALVGRNGTLGYGDMYATMGAGLIAGLATAFSTSIWFSAVEGEVYAMSTFFTALTFWSMIKWYNLPNTKSNDRWLIFTVFMAGISVGVHLLSLLTFPALAIFYYYKKYKEHTFLGVVISAVIGAVLIGLIQNCIIVGIPYLWSACELMMVNTLGMPKHAGLLPLFLIIASIFGVSTLFAHGQQTIKSFGFIAGGLVLCELLLRMGSTDLALKNTFIPAIILVGLVALAAYFAGQYNKRDVYQMMVIGALMVTAGFSLIGVIVIRANANTPINMNNPSDPMRLIPYLNREQYGERALLHGPSYKNARPDEQEQEDRFGYVESTGKYEIVDYKLSNKYKSSNKSFFPRMSDANQGRPDLYRQWRGGDNSTPNFIDNVKFMMRYQVGWMYTRYFMWNFAGRQNGEQGYFDWNEANGNWSSGITAVDESFLYNQELEPKVLKENKARNKYYMLPLIFGLIGFFFHIIKRPNDFLGLFALFIITGIGIIIYSNQPPNEPRERDYVLVGSFFTFCIWIGMGALAIYSLLKEKVKLGGVPAAGLASLLVLSAPVLMGTQNFDDHSRAEHSGSRDYAANFLNSCEPNAIIFTYGDNDTYPLWYAQEVENIRRDVRVVNLSLIAVDWYIDQLRRKVNDSDPIKFTISKEAYRGKNRNQVPHASVFGLEGSRNPYEGKPMSLTNLLKFIGDDKNKLKAQQGKEYEYFPTRNVYIGVDPVKAKADGWANAADTAIVNRIPINLANKQYLLKDELAILDVIASNAKTRPVYFAVTCRPEKMFGLDDYMQLEGLGLKIVPIKARSDQRYGVYGNGRVNQDKVYENVMNKFAWGNFDNEELDLFIDRSYGPSIQSHYVLMWRTMQDMLDSGDKKRAREMGMKYLESFPNNNFAYDYRTMRILNLLINAGGSDLAKPHLKQLVRNNADFMKFYFSLPIDQVLSDFRDDYALSSRTKTEIYRELDKLEDPELTKFVDDTYKEYYEPARKYVPGLANETFDYVSQLFGERNENIKNMSPEERRNIEQRIAYGLQLSDDLKEFAKTIGDTDMAAELEALFKPLVDN